MKAKIEAIEEEEERRKPKGFNLRTLKRANDAAEAGRMRRQQAAAKAEPPRNAVQHARPFACFFGKSESFGSNAYSGGLLGSSSNNKDL